MLGVRCPTELHERLLSRLEPRQTATGAVLAALEILMALEEEAGERLPELKAAALLERSTFGRAVARLALEGLDARKRKSPR